MWNIRLYFLPFQALISFFSPLKDDPVRKFVVTSHVYSQKSQSYVIGLLLFKEPQVDMSNTKMQHVKVVVSRILE